MPSTPPGPPEVLSTRDLVIRRYRSEDATALHESITTSFDHLRPWMEWIKYEPLSVEQRETLISEWNSRWQEGSEFTMGVFMNDLLIGSTGLHFRGEPDVVEIGYWIDARYTRRGFARQIVDVLTELAFALWPNVGRVEIHVDINNEASNLVAERSGFQKHETSHRAPRAPGEQGLLVHWAKRRNNEH